MRVAGFQCPLDGLPLNEAEVKSEIADDRDPRFAKATKIGKHIHVAIDEPLKCANGHAWRVSPFMMSREE